MIPIYSILIRRDAHTLTPVSVPEYEIPILQELFGVENIQNEEGKRIDDVGLGNPSGEFQESDDEYTRVCIKYGEEKVDEVYGKKATKGFDNAFAAIKKGKAASKAKE